MLFTQAPLEEVQKRASMHGVMTMKGAKRTTLGSCQLLRGVQSLCLIFLSLDLWLEKDMQHNAKGTCAATDPRCQMYVMPPKGANG